MLGPWWDVQGQTPAAALQDMASDLQDGRLCLRESEEEKVLPPSRAQALQTHELRPATGEDEVTPTTIRPLTRWPFCPLGCPTVVSGSPLGLTQKDQDL